MYPKNASQLPLQTHLNATPGVQGSGVDAGEYETRTCSRRSSSSALWKVVPAGFGLGDGPAGLLFDAVALAGAGGEVAGAGADMISLCFRK